MVEGDQGLIAERYTSVSVEATDLQERLTDYGSLQILGAYRPFSSLFWLMVVRNNFPVFKRGPI